jgi:hypothetical protein
MPIIPSAKDKADHKVGLCLVRSGSILEVKLRHQHHLSWMVRENSFWLIKGDTTGNFHCQNICPGETQASNVANVSRQKLRTIEKV